jgi:hypothetical protein
VRRGLSRFLHSLTKPFSLRAGKCYLKINNPDHAIFACTSSREVRIQLAADKGLSLSEYEIALDEGLDLDTVDPADFEIMNLTG